MQDDDVRFESIEDSEDDELDPRVANDLEGSIFSGGDPDDTTLTEDTDDENDDEEPADDEQ